MFVRLAAFGSMSLIALSGCSFSQEETSAGADETGSFESALDLGVGQPIPPTEGILVEPGASAEHDLTTGRIAKLPVSTADVFTLARTGAHDVVFRAVCSEADTTAGRCDTGLLVFTASNTWFNDNSPNATTFGTGSKGSSVDPPAISASRTYTVVVFSKRRATSRTFVDWSANGGSTWTRLSGSGTIEAGGTLVKVGPLATGDFLEVQTRSNGTGNGDTRMYLFDPDNSMRTTIASDDQSTSDRDPRIDITNGSWLLGTDNMLLIGKRARSTASNSGVETHVDLRRGPSVETSVALGAEATLQPGRYLLSLFATVALPVGEYNPSNPNTFNLSSDMPTLQNDGCPNSTKDELPNPTWYRGQPNDFALTMIIQRFDGTGWVNWKTRKIPRGAFGMDPGQGWNKFGMDLAVDTAARFRVTTSNAVSGITLFQDWRYERNPDASEMKVVSYNSYYAANSFSANKYRNLANLLGTRGTVYASTARVEERPDQAPWQLDADVIGLQETERGAAYVYYSDITLAELEARGSLAWTYATGEGEEWTFNLGDGPGMSPTFVNEQHFPGSGENSAWFSSAARSFAGCESGGGQANWMQCHMSEQGYGSGDIYNYATASKAAAWRNDSTLNRPIALFNVHMEASEGPADFAPRVGELESLMAKIDLLLQADHRAFNRAPETDTAKSSPGHYQNRFIVLGDWNIRAHECGEHYWMVRKLREHYGYAVDVAMSIQDSRGSLKQGSHVGDFPLYISGAPLNFQHWSVSRTSLPPLWVAWNAAPDYGDTAYPWWTVDWRDKTSATNKVGERLSMIVLVGKGWAYDDPVLAYNVMADNVHVTPMNPYGRGVEMWRNDDCNNPGSVPNDSRGYAPNHSLGCDPVVYGGTNPGAPALHSDHRPMSVRLRVWQR